MPISHKVQVSHKLLGPGLSLACLRPQSPLAYGFVEKRYSLKNGNHTYPASPARRAGYWEGKISRAHLHS